MDEEEGGGGGVCTLLSLRLLWPNKGYKLRVSYIAVTGEVMKGERRKIYQVSSFPTVRRGLLQGGGGLIYH